MRFGFAFDCLVADPAIFSQVTRPAFALRVRFVNWRFAIAAFFCFVCYPTRAAQARLLPRLATDFILAFFTAVIRLHWLSMPYRPSIHLKTIAGNSSVSIK